jgi:hypothetical protein
MLSEFEPTATVDHCFRSRFHVCLLRATVTGFDNDVYFPPTFSPIAIFRAVMEQAWMHL